MGPFPTDRIYLYKYFQTYPVPCPRVEIRIADLFPGLKIIVTSVTIHSCGTTAEVLCLDGLYIPEVIS